MPHLADLTALSRALPFEGHDIRNELDSTGRYAMRFRGDFQLSIRLFRYRAESFTRGVTWHEQLELFVPITGKVDVQMGSSVVSLRAGDLLLMDNLKLHHVIDAPGLDARVAVISFLPEFVYSLGSSSHDFAFLLPFYAQLDAEAHVMRSSERASVEARSAVSALLREYFLETKRPHWEAACKCRLMALLLVLARHFQGNSVLQWEFEKRRNLSQRFSKLLERLRSGNDTKVPLNEAARMCAMSPAAFTRSFRKASGMSYLEYVTHLRLSEAARLLRLGEKSIAEIAETTGFADQSHLDRRFKRAFGMTPRTFREHGLASEKTARG